MLATLVRARENLLTQEQHSNNRNEDNSESHHGEIDIRLLKKLTIVRPVRPENGFLSPGVRLIIFSRRHQCYVANVTKDDISLTVMLTLTSKLIEI